MNTIAYHNLDYRIQFASKGLKEAIMKKINLKTKPVGALGQLENLALQICLIQQSLTPKLNNPALAIFAGDHGIARSGVSAYPQEVTFQMVYNFLNGGAAINVFCKQHDIMVKIVDAGVNHDFPTHADLIDAKIRKGTKNMLEGPAMTEKECRMAFEMSGNLVDELWQNGSNIIGFGEMGIGNTSSASLIMSQIMELPLSACIGTGTGLDQEGLDRKLTVLQQILSKNPVDQSDPMAVISTFGGYEIAMICGGMLKAAEHKMIILVDGFIATSALLIASSLYPEVLDYCIFGHQSEEKGHQAMLEFLGAKPVLRLGMRLGEGTGATLAYPIIESAVNFMNQMASFDQAGVSKHS
ncbi:MAG: nicotinate-nucleotide--dimethylbenzimidazole phosphoribosyltransferase [Candidatus Cyclobacteriaceae bacterium M3_2C_046]